MKIRINHDTCIGAGQCALVAGAVFDQDDAGLVVLLQDVPSAEFHVVARKAAALCPTKAIVVEE